ncbi:hypothetical protein P2318_00290 [Myxococcaceae bacterium GXIMD 01537]
MVGLSHLLTRDTALVETMSLEPGWEAERAGIGSAWVRRKLAE